MHSLLLCLRAGLAGPFIVKPLVACGVSHSHSMALVLQPGALHELHDRLPLPAVVQEFVNHGGVQWKVYVLGDKVGTEAAAAELLMGLLAYHYLCKCCCWAWVVQMLSVIAELSDMHDGSLIQSLCQVLTGA